MGLLVSEFVPVMTIRDFKTLDESDVLIGYMDGVEGIPHPGSGHSRSYWHGWRNGMVDSGRSNLDDVHRTLASSFQALHHPIHN